MSKFLGKELIYNNNEIWHEGNFNPNTKQNSLGSGTTSQYLRGDGTWATPPNTNTTYSEITTAEIDAGTSATLRTITGRRIKYILDKIRAETSSYGVTVGKIKPSSGMWYEEI